MVFGRVAVGALLMFCGFFMVATVVRSRLIIEGSQTRFRIVFREEVFPLSEIERFRTILLEEGTKYIGETRGDVRQGQARIGIIWTEARTPTGVLVPMKSPGMDALGRAYVVSLNGPVYRLDPRSVNG